MIRRFGLDFFRLVLWWLLLFQVTQIYAQPDSKGVGLKLVDKLPSAEKRFALIIGINSYDDANISPLRGASNDAKRLAEILQNYAGFTPDRIILLTSDAPPERRPTRNNILKRLSNLKSAVPKDGLLLFSFSGHGIAQGDSAFLIPSDGSLTDDIDTLKEIAIGVERVRSAIKNTGISQVLMLIDACRNDPAAGRGEVNNTLTPAYGKGFSFDIKNKEVEAFATLYATSIGERAFEYGEKQQGYFSWAVTEGLAGKAADEKGRVTLGSLVRYVEEIVPRQVRIDIGNQHQRPFADIEGFKANELVLSMVEPKPPPAPAQAKKAVPPESPKQEPVFPHDPPPPNTEYVHVPEGTFMMGFEGSQFRVTLSGGFEIGATEVTQAQWQAVTGKNPSFFKGCNACPVENVSWQNVKDFIARLNAKQDGFAYRLPTEAEWEYAARAGSTVDYSKDLNALGWNSGNSDNRTRPVKEKLPNKWGIYDVYGNVSEWVEDWYDPSLDDLTPVDTMINPTGPPTGTMKVVRGCSFADGNDKCRIAYRNSSAPGEKSGTTGFRLVRRIDVLRDPRKKI